MGKNCNICSFLCWGQDNYHGSCCSIENRDWIIGPHLDTDEFVARLSEKIGKEVSKESVFIYYEEGKNIFPDRSVWQEPSSYPAIRLNFDTNKKSCIFYNNNLRFCSIYDIRPAICQSYKCEYLKENGENEEI